MVSFRRVKTNDPTIEASQKNQAHGNAGVFENHASDVEFPGRIRIL